MTQIATPPRALRRPKARSPPTAQAPASDDVQARLHRAPLPRLRTGSARRARLRVHAVASARSKRSTTSMASAIASVAGCSMRATRPSGAMPSCCRSRRCPTRRSARRRVAAASTRRGWPPGSVSTRLWVKDDSRNPTLSFKDRPVAVAAARAAEWGFHTLACASTGNLAPAVAAAAAARGLRAVVFIPADLEAAKVAQARALGATVVRVDGPYDDVNRLCLELTDELEGWAVLNVNLRPFYAEGSKTIAFEIAQQLGWRAPDALFAPLASGSMYTKLARGFSELASRRAARRGARPLLRWPGQRLLADRRRPSPPAPISCGRWRSPTPSCVRSSIGSPADGGYAIQQARESDGGHPRRALTRRPSPPSGCSPRPRASSPRPPAASRWPRCGGPSTRAGCDGTRRPCWSSPATASRHSTSLTVTPADCPSPSHPASTPSRPGGAARARRRPPEVRAGHPVCGVAAVDGGSVTPHGLDGAAPKPADSALDDTSARSQAEAARGPAWRHGPRRLRSGTTDSGPLGKAPRAADTDRGDCGLFVCSERLRRPPQRRRGTTHDDASTHHRHRQHGPSHRAARSRARGDEVVAMVGRETGYPAAGRAGAGRRHLRVQPRPIDAASTSTWRSRPAAAPSSSARPAGRPTTRPARPCRSDSRRPAPARWWRRRSASARCSSASWPSTPPASSAASATTTPIVFEQHRAAKADRPSGTALAVADRLLPYLAGEARGAAGQGSGAPDADVLEVVALRAGSHPGMHIVGFDGPGEALETPHHGT